MPFFVLLLATLMSAGTAAAAQLKCIDAARAGARAAARHADPRALALAAAPDGAEVRVAMKGELVTVGVSADVALPLPWHPRVGVRAESTAHAEPGLGG